MRCMNCGANIPPEWINAIQSNLCPGCGKEIMNSQTQDLLKELTDAMQKMPNDPAGVAGWLLSNYRFQKVGEAQPVEKFHRQGGSGVVSLNEPSLKIAPNYNQFVQRNNAVEVIEKSNALSAKYHGNKNGRMAELASLIQDVGDIHDNIPETVNGEDSAAYLELKNAGIDPFAVTPSAIPNGNFYQAINDVAQEIASQEESLLSQSDKGRAILKNNEMKRIKAQDAIMGGGGSFRRA
jgi:hypothetical protein